MRVFLYADSHATLMLVAASVLRRTGNKLYQHAYPLYRPLYAAYKAYTDRVERELLRNLLFPGAVVADIGANIGIYSEFLSRCIGPNGTVHSFEPSPENFKRLHAATSKLSNVQIYQAGVGEHSGKSELYISDKLNVDHRSYSAEGGFRRTIPIEMVALDDYFKVGEPVDLIKMDIQGYELHALRGANRVLADNTDIKLLLEFWPYGLKQAGATWQDLIAALIAKKMVIKQVSNKGLIPFDSESVSENADWYANLFATRSRSPQPNRFRGEAGRMSVTLNSEMIANLPT
jgi:FkbM family methyltransferase